MTREDYAEMLSQAKDQFKKGTPLFGKDGAFHQILEDFLNAALEAELDDHLQQSKVIKKRIGVMGKCLRTCKRIMGPWRLKLRATERGALVRR